MALVQGHPGFVKVYLHSGTGVKAEDENGAGSDSPYRGLRPQPKKTECFIETNDAKSQGALIGL